MKHYLAYSFPGFEENQLLLLLTTKYQMNFASKICVYLYSSYRLRNFNSAGLNMYY